MTLKQKLASVFILIVASCSAPQNGDAISNHTPKLVVVITVDQLRGDLLDINGDDFSAGFRRLLDGGMRYENAWVDHAPTNSYPGHASIATGAHPKTHGFSDNSWKARDGDGWRRVYASNMLPHDCNAEGGAAQGEGLLVPTLGERFLASGGKFAAISASRQIARIYAGAARAPVLWLIPEEGGYVTTLCYGAEAPSWVRKFNEETLPNFATGRWDLTLAPEITARLRPDASSFEGEGGPNAFPHVAAAEEDPLNWFYDTPAADASALALAIEAIKAERLGQDDTPDLLNVVINTIDNTGHRYGPFSVEQADNLFQLDRNLGDFMTQLDVLVGRNEWTLVLTGDHGAAPAPETLPDHPTARRVSAEEVEEVIASAHRAADAFGSDDPARYSAAAEAVEAFAFVEKVYVGDEILNAAANGDDTAAIYANSFLADRPARHPFYDSEDKSLADLGLTPVLKEYVVVNWATSIHGSHYDYDRAVPILFYGAGVTPGLSDEFVRTIDIAPTLAALANISSQPRFDGASLPLKNASD